jgi:hypothetical protein
MRWPRGRYNGRRVVGVRVAVSIDVTVWLWRPVVGQWVGALHWFCLRSWWGFEYE